MMRPTRIDPDRHHAMSSRLTQRQISEIVRLHNKRLLTPAEIARRLRLSQSVVSRVLTWWFSRS